MNFKIFLLSFLLLKSCAMDVEYNYKYITQTPHVEFLFMNLTGEDVYVWYDAVYGDERREISDLTKASPRVLLPIYLSSKFTSIHGMMTENNLRNRLDSLFVYVSESQEGYIQWQQKKHDEIMDSFSNEDTDYHINQYTIYKSNIDYVIGMDEKIPLYFNGF